MSKKSFARLILVRHGETDWNLERRYQGSQDIPLNEQGRLQAKRLFEHHREIQLHAIYSSHLKRAKETAEIIRGERNFEVKVEIDLREGNYGSLEGLLYQEARTRYASHYAQFEMLSNDEKMHYKIVPDQETSAEVLKRTKQALKKICQNHLDQTILIVTHGGVIRALILMLEKQEYSSIDIKNGQTLILLSDGEQFLISDESKVI